MDKRLVPGELLLIPEMITGSKSLVFCKVEHAPIGMMACPSQEKLNAMKDDNLRNENLIKGFCIERYFERLPGFIDVTVLTEA